MYIPDMTVRLRKQAGVSLIELIMFIVIVSVGLAGILSVMNITTRASADPLVRKQAIAIAESLLEEIQLQPFTWCDPNDAQASTATGAFVGAAGCSSAAEVEAFGAETISAQTETRYAEPFFDNVNDYHGFAMDPVADITNTPMPMLAGYRASVTVQQAGATFGMAADTALRIDVRVISGSNVDITLTGYRFRYAPTTTP